MVIETREIESISIPEAAKRLGIHPATLRRGIKNGIFPLANNYGLRKWRIPLPAFEKYLNTIRNDVAGAGACSQ